jgi:glucose-1-phosphate thymidylyltransferase
MGQDQGRPWPLRPLRRELAPVANTALIALEMRALRDAGIHEIAIVSDAELAGAAREAAREFVPDVDLVHIAPPDEPGLARLLLAVEPFVGHRPFVAELAASLTPHDLGRSMELLVRKRLAAVVVVAQTKRRDPHVTLLPVDGPLDAVGVERLGEEVLTSANAFVFGTGVFDAARAAIERRPDEAVEVADVLDVLAEHPDQVQAVLATGWSRRLEDVEDLLDLNRLALDSIGPEEVAVERSGNRIMGPVLIDDTATIESSVLNGPVAIAAGAHITDSYVGPYTAIGSRARIDGAEIERSVILPDASVSSVGFRIEGSVIGASARVTRELAPPRALKLWIGQDACVSLA